MYKQVAMERFSRACEISATYATAPIPSLRLISRVSAQPPPFRPSALVHNKYPGKHNSAVLPG